MIRDSNEEEGSRLHLCVIGPMVGRTPGRVISQGLMLAALLRKSGFFVIAVSACLNRYWRLTDIIYTIIRRRHDVRCLVIEIYGGTSFVVEDIASLLGKWFGKPIIMWLHGGNMPKFMARYPRWTRRLLSRADVLVAPSAYLVRAVVRHGFNARVIPNVIDISNYPHRPRRILRPRLFWMRSFSPMYGPEMALRVLARLRSTIPEATLVMAGQKDTYEVEVYRLAEEMGLKGAIRFPGFLDLQKKVAEAENADIYLNTNHIDNTPVAVIEACAMGLPVVATAVGGIPDLLTDEENGLLVPDGDDEAMANAVRRLLSDPELAARLSANGRRLAERSSWELVFPQWKELIKEVTVRQKQQRTLFFAAISNSLDYSPCLFEILSSC